MAVTTTKPLAASILPNDRALRIAGYVLLALAGSLVMAISAKVKVPFYPVPMNLQTLALMAIAAGYGLRLGTATIALYLLEGALGLPVFTSTPEKGIGLAYMMGPTGGFLAGFLVAAIIVGFAVERGWSGRPVKLFGAMLAADVVLFALGIAWLGALFGWDKPILEWGLYPFVLGDLVKVALAASGIAAVDALLRPRA